MSAKRPNPPGEDGWTIFGGICDLLSILFSWL
jgi:hypothetical protein